MGYLASPSVVIDEATGVFKNKRVQLLLAVTVRPYATATAKDIIQLTETSHGIQ
jgi:hypothetical protein